MPDAAPPLEMLASALLHNCIDGISRLHELTAGNCLPQPPQISFCSDPSAREMILGLADARMGFA
jgi:hypothetical protein